MRGSMSPAIWERMKYANGRPAFQPGKPLRRERERDLVTGACKAPAGRAWSRRDRSGEAAAQSVAERVPVWTHTGRVRPLLGGSVGLRASSLGEHAFDPALEACEIPATGPRRRGEV